MQTFLAIFGTMSYGESQRTREKEIRAASAGTDAMNELIQHLGAVLHPRVPTHRGDSQFGDGIFAEGCFQLLCLPSRVEEPALKWPVAPLTQPSVFHAAFRLSARHLYTRFDKRNE